VAGPQRARFPWRHVDHTEGPEGHLGQAVDASCIPFQVVCCGCRFCRVPPGQRRQTDHSRRRGRLRGCWPKSVPSIRNCFPPSIVEIRPSPGERKPADLREFPIPMARTIEPYNVLWREVAALLRAEEQSSAARAGSRTGPSVHSVSTARRMPAMSMSSVNAGSSSRDERRYWKQRDGRSRRSRGSGSAKRRDRSFRLGPGMNNLDVRKKRP
jgi:hypothetical protein